MALLAYLAVERTATRDKLAGLFWAESSQERARATLRRTLSSLRSAVPERTVEANRDTITLIEANSDLDAFDEALAATESHDHAAGDVCQLCVAPLGIAVDLYRADFLAGFSIKDAPDFEDWSRTVAESYRIKAGDALGRFAMAQAGAGDYSAAISAVNTWIDHDSLHEPAHRLLMLLNAWAGDKPGSIEAYRSFVAILDRELGVTPLDATTELYEAILDEDLPPAPGVPKKTAVAITDVSPTRARLIDRQEQTDRLETLIQTSGVVITLEGGPWMGKTRLIDEVVAAMPSVLFLRGRSHRMEQELPYAVIAQLLGSCAEELSENGVDVDEWALGEASRIAPKLAPGLRPSGEDEFGDLRLFEAVLAVIEGVAATRPTVVVVDDAQWLDKASAAAIGFIAGRVVPGLSLLVAYRPGGGGPLLSLPPDVHTVGLPSLTEADISDLTDDPAAAISSTGGVPLLITEYLEGSDATVEMGRYIDARMAGLGALARQVLTTAAVLTGTCDVPLLRDVSGRSEDEVVEAVEELIEAGLIDEVGNHGELEFNLEALERVAYDSLKLVRRRLLHRRAGETLSARPRARTDARLAGAAAAQFRGAGDERAAQWYALAGDLSRTEYAYDSTRNFYESAIALGSADAASHHLALGEIAIVIGEYDDALTTLTAAAARADQGLMAAVEHRLGEVHRLLGRFEAARRHFDRSVAADPYFVAALTDWAMLEHRLGADDRALELAERGVKAAETGGDQRQLGRANSILGVVSPDQADAMGYLDAALEMSANDDVARMACLNNKAHLLAEIGDDAAAMLLLEEATEIASRTGHRHREAALRSHRADLLYAAGDRARAEEQQRLAARLFASVGTSDWEPEVWMLTRW